MELALTGQPVRIEVYEPRSPARGAVVLAHGFLRSPATMAGYAQAIAREGLLAIVPELPYVTDSRENARALAELVGRIREGAVVSRQERIVLVGFSAGGLATLLAAASPGVVGYVGLDAFDRPGGVGLKAARALPTPAVLLYGPPAFCNAYAIAQPWREALPALVHERLIPEASHCDFESPTDRLCTLVCGPTDTSRQREIAEAVLDAVKRFVPRRPD